MRCGRHNAVAHLRSRPWWVHRSFLFVYQPLSTRLVALSGYYCETKLNWRVKVGGANYRRCCVINRTTHKRRRMSMAIPPCDLAVRTICDYNYRLDWGYSSAGRALAWHARGQRFDPAYLHQINTVEAPESPSSRGLGHDPFTVVTGVRIPLGTPRRLRTARKGGFFTSKILPKALYSLGFTSEGVRRSIKQAGKEWGYFWGYKYRRRAEQVLFVRLHRPIPKLFKCASLYSNSVSWLRLQLRR